MERESYSDDPLTHRKVGFQVFKRGKWERWTIRAGVGINAKDGKVRIHITGKDLCNHLLSIRERN
jgi:hypothetical protein